MKRKDELNKEEIEDMETMLEDVVSDLVDLDKLAEAMPVLYDDMRPIGEAIAVIAYFILCQMDYLVQYLDLDIEVPVNEMSIRRRRTHNDEED